MKYTEKEQRSVIWCLSCDCVKTGEIYLRTAIQYGDNYVKQLQVYEWVGRSIGERKSDIDDACSNRPSTLVWTEFKKRIYQHIRVNANKNGTVSEIEGSDGRLDYCDGIKKTVDRWL